MVFDKQAFWQSATAVDEEFLNTINSCMVLAPHPDDESLGCGGLIARLCESGKKVSIVLSTDGSMSHPGSVKYTAGDRTAKRKQELLTALSILGVDEQHVYYLDGKDSALPALDEMGFATLQEKLEHIISIEKPDLCLVPYELDPHRDHRASWQLLNAALSASPSNGVTVWEYPIWLYELADKNDIPQLQNGELKYLDIQNFLQQKRSAIDAHLSQTTNLLDDPEGFHLTEHMISNFLNGREYFIERSGNKKEITLPMDYFESLYQKEIDPWNFEQSEYERKKYETTIDYLPRRTYQNALEIGCSIGVLSEMLAGRCDTLLSIDISSTALTAAKKRLKDNPSVTFEQRGIPENFPAGNYDLIVMSEVGYYLSTADLMKAKARILETMQAGANLILVHWTHYVTDYPLTGDQVHEIFHADSMLQHKSATRTADYRLDVFEKA